MLTYQLQRRLLRIKKQGTTAFPLTATIRLTLEPASMFGAAAGRTRFVLLGGSLSVFFDANTGHSYAGPDPPLAPLSVRRDLPHGTYVLQGQQLVHGFQCADEEALAERAATLCYLLPPALTAQLPEPVSVASTYCVAGDTEYNWELAGSVIPFTVLTKDLIEESVGTALTSLPVIVAPTNRRLAAALHYVFVARRLLSAGVSRWECLAEALLSFNKAIEVAFGDSRDEQRTGLAAIGFDRATIERAFIPLLLLRDWLDVAHPRLAILKDSELERIYAYLVRFEGTMRDFVKHLSTAVETGRYQCADTGDLTLPRDVQRALDRLLAMIADDSNPR